MEQLLVIIQQICEFLSILNSYTQEEREELLERYPRFLFEAKELLSILDRIVGGSTYWGWKIEWGCQPWHLMTYRHHKEANRLYAELLLCVCWDTEHI